MSQNLTARMFSHDICQHYLSVLCCFPGKHSRRGEKAQGFAQDCCCIWELVKLLIAGLALEGIRLLDEPLLSLWMLAEQIYAVGHSNCCGFIACQHDEVGLSCDLPAEASGGAVRKPVRDEQMQNAHPLGGPLRSMLVDAGAQKGVPKGVWTCLVGIW